MTAPDPAAIRGECDPRFDAVRDAFASNFAEHAELGAAVAIHVAGKLVVNLSAGVTSRSDPQPFTDATLVHVYSTTKGLAALCIQHLIEAGRLDPDAPVARFWPEFAAHGKQAITLRELLGHRAGLAALRERLPHEALYDHARMASALAAAEPLWEPGSRHAYHAQTFGFLLGELVRRVTDTTLGAYLREHFAGPASADVFIGLPAEYDARVAKVTRPLGEAPPPGEMDLLRVMKTEPESLSALAFGNPPAAPGSSHTRAFRAAEMPSSNGHASALGLSRIYGALAASGGGSGLPRLLGPEALARCSEEISAGHDEVLRLNTRFGPGFMLSQPEGRGRFGPNPRSFGHPGMGGSIAFADPDAGVGFGYVMNRAGPEILVSARPRRLIEALYDSL